MPKKIEHIGRRYGRLVVLKFEERRYYKKGTQLFFRCICDCGNESVVQSTHLTGGHTTSCGCFMRERQIAANTTHGHTVGGVASPELSVWNSMNTRCANPNNGCYERYGGRGITVCERWTGENGFENFLKDMGPRPSLDYTLDRIDNSKGYSPENCRWADKFTQARNTRRNVNLTLNGITKCAAEWNRHLGLGTFGVQARIRNGWSLHDALTTPSMILGRRKRDKPHSADIEKQRDDPRYAFTD